MRNRYGRYIAAAAGIILVLLLSACVSARPYLVPGQSLPEAEDTPEPEISIAPTAPAVSAEPVETDKSLSKADALGNAISGADHFKQYLQLQNIQVYEECEDTFIDADLVSAYPEPLICAIEIVFYRDGIEIASSNLQTRDGQYILSVTEGRTAVYGQVDTDLSVTGLDFEVVFNEDIGVEPQ